MEQGNKPQGSGEVAVKKKLTKEELARLYRQIKDETEADLSERIKYFENERVFDAHWAVPSYRKVDWILIAILFGVCIACLFVGDFVMIPWFYG